MAISRDGRFALSGSEEDELRYWDLAQGKEVRQLKGHTKGTCSVAISPDGRLGLSGSVDGTARLWDLEKRNLPARAGGGRAVGLGGRLHARWSARHHRPPGWDARPPRREGWPRSPPLRRSSGAYIRNVQASGDGRLILSAGSGALRLWDAASGDEVYQLRGVGGGIVCGIILPGDREVLFGCYDTTVRLWRLPDSVGKAKVNEPVPAFPPEGKVGTAVALDRDKRFEYPVDPPAALSNALR